MIQEIADLVQKKLQEYTGLSNTALEFFSVGGGSINKTYQIKFGGQQFFCKINAAATLPGLFEKEKNGLELLGKQNFIRIPVVISTFQISDQQILLLEWIEAAERNKKFWEHFGSRLAQLHQVRAPGFGLEENNYMGSMVQSNNRSDNWCTFFREQRLIPLIKNSLDKKLISRAEVTTFEKIFTKLPGVFYQFQSPSLLHGDLWSGNFICASGEPVLIDPAVYFGHPSVDLAMTKLFGGFDPVFYKSYHSCSPFPSNYKEQWMICNLYPLLVHLVLFGKTYLPQINQTLKYFS